MNDLTPRTWKCPECGALGTDAGHNPGCSRPEYPFGRIGREAPSPLTPSEAAQVVGSLIAERDKLQAFKTWVHDYLDTHGVPHHPPGTHGAEGCRIGDRMDWLMAELAAAKAGTVPGRFYACGCAALRSTNIKACCPVHCKPILDVE